MDKRKLQAVINRIKSDIDSMRSTLSELKREQALDYEQYGAEVVDSELYELDIKIAEVSGYIECSMSVIKKLDMLMESINK